MVFSGFSADGLVETIELPDHPWFVACQFHPEFTSNLEALNWETGTVLSTPSIDDIWERVIVQDSDVVNNNQRFDPDFITSVLEKHQKYNEFTDRQASAISNIYERFKVAEYLEKQQ